MPKKENKNKRSLLRADGFEIIEKLRKGDAYAFRKLFKQQYKPLVKYARRYVRATQAAEDIVGDVFLKIWEKRSELDINISIKAYMFKMVRNQSINYLKSNRPEATDVFYLSLTIQSTVSADERVRIEDLEKHIEKAVSELPDRTREVFTLHRYDSLKYSEIAEVLNIKEGTVETHMVRALKYLRKRLAFLLSLVIVLGKYSFFIFLYR